VQNALGSGGHLVVSSKEIFSIVGRDWGLGCKHASAIFIMWTTPSAAPFLGSEMGGLTHPSMVYVEQSVASTMMTKILVIRVLK
jgi:hypothetical protein